MQEIIEMWFSEHANEQDLQKFIFPYEPVLAKQYQDKIRKTRNILED